MLDCLDQMKGHARAPLSVYWRNMRARTFTERSSQIDGAGLAFGCNIGGLLAGTATGSVRGWLWLLAGFIGSWIGVYAPIWFGLDGPMEKTDG